MKFNSKLCWNVFKIGKRTNDVVTTRDQLVSAIKIQYNGLNGQIIYLLFINMAICMLVALYTIYRDR